MMDQAPQTQPKRSGIRPGKSAAVTDDAPRVLAKPGLLKKTLPRKLERPMLLLRFAWFLLIIAGLVAWVMLMT
jgi:hypothetical protein